MKITKSTARLTPTCSSRRSSENSQRSQKELMDHRWHQHFPTHCTWLSHMQKVQKPPSQTKDGRLARLPSDIVFITLQDKSSWLPRSSHNKLNRNTTTKGYCAVFTCAITRTVHLTCVQDASTPAFLQALERFVSIRGAPSMIISDNGTCFRGANNTINELNLKLDCNEICSYCQRYNVEWRFGPPGGLHCQGAVERMVQEVKKGMILTRFSTFMTTVCVNYQPIWDLSTWKNCGKLKRGMLNRRFVPPRDNTVE